MTTNDYLTYYIPAVRNITDNSFDLRTLNKFDEAIGHPDMYVQYMATSPSEDKSMSKELKELLKVFSGPHGKALWKAYLIRKGEQNE